MSELNNTTIVGEDRAQIKDERQAFPFPFPVETHCILVEKVYDNCYQTDRATTSTALVEVEQPELITCNVDPDSITCVATVGDPVVIGSNCHNVTILVTVDGQLSVDGTPEDITYSLVKTVELCVPEGTLVDCQATVIGSCDHVLIDGATEGDYTAVASVPICVVIRSTASVQLNVVGTFCTPKQCCDTAISGTCPPLGIESCSPCCN